MGRSLAFLILFVSLIAGVVSGGQAAETVWSGLVIAENVAQPQAVPPELTRIEGSLKKFFGYNQFQVIGQSQKTLKTGQEDWLATSKFFGLHVDAQGESKVGYVLSLKLYKEKELARNGCQAEQTQSPGYQRSPGWERAIIARVSNTISEVFHTGNAHPASFFSG